MNVLRAIAHPVRLGVLQTLNDRGELTVGELLRTQPDPTYSQSALSQHLAVLRREGLVTTRKDRQRVFYALHPVRLAEVYTVIGRLQAA